MSGTAPKSELVDVPRLSPEARRDFAVVIPAYNEVENMPALVSELRSMFARHDLSGEVLLVDDGSTDGTAEAAEREAAGWDRFRVVRHRRNFGKTEAMVTAAEHTGARWLVLYDADLQHAPDDIPRFLAELDGGWDIVTGRKTGHYEKRAVSSIYNRLSRSIFDIPVSDTNSMKAFRRDILDEVRLRHDWHRFFVVLAYARGFSMTEIDIELLPRRAGVAKYSGKGRIVVGLLDLVSVWFFLFFSRKPMLLFGISGLVSATLGILVGLVTIVLRASHWVSPIGYRPLLYLVLLLEVLGFLLIGFGFIAELMAQQHSEIDALHREVSRVRRGDDERGGLDRRRA
ncbi:MAG TPA: glycosyltransferase [Longimicrobiales bacterium]|nr:glycosyltransferase [Longimicrobiales bacterium]